MHISQHLVDRRRKNSHSTDRDLFKDGQINLYHRKGRRKHLISRGKYQNIFFGGGQNPLSNEINPLTYLTVNQNQLLIFILSFYLISSKHDSKNYLIVTFWGFEIKEENFIMLKSKKGCHVKYSENKKLLLLTWLYF